MKRLCALLICLLLTCAAALAADIPEPTEDFYVYDGANVLDYETEGHIVFCNRELYEACGAEIGLRHCGHGGQRDDGGTIASRLSTSGKWAMRASRTALW